MWSPRVAARVPEDATLDQFASGDSDDESDRGENGESDADRPERSDEDGSAAGDAVAGESGDGAAGESGDAAAAPAVSTHRFAPDGRACADCDARATRLWRDGDSLVCESCKEWQE